MVNNIKRSRGRPRKFDEDEAIRMATNVFWAKGFDGATIDDLVEGMGVGRPSLYAIFGDKSTLFVRCLEAYREDLGKQAAQALFGPTHVREAIRALLRFSVETATDPGSLITSNEETTKAIAMRLNQGIEAKELPVDFPSEERSRMLADMSRGLRVRARIGVPRQELLEDADRAAELFLHG